MLWTDLAALGSWLQGMEPVLLLAASLLSIGILLGCAMTSWFAPSEKKDCLFHREVI